MAYSADVPVVAAEIALSIAVVGGDAGGSVHAATCRFRRGSRVLAALVAVGVAVGARNSGVDVIAGLEAAIEVVLG